MLDHISLAGIRPDLCLIAVCLIGFVRGEAEGAIFGLALGFVQDLFTASDLWLNMATKGVAGLVAGVTSRHLASATFVALLTTLASLSLLSGLIFLVWGRGVVEIAETLESVRSVLIPQVVFDTAVGGALFWLIARHVWKGRPMEGAPGY
jgi:rod shape-determining protein MreD